MCNIETSGNQVDKAHRLAKGHCVKRNSLVPIEARARASSGARARAGGTQNRLKREDVLNKITNWGKIVVC